MTAATLFYACRVRLDEQVRYLSWYTGERDGFLRSDAGMLIVELDVEGLAKSTARLGVVLEPDPPADYDFDQIGRWCCAVESPQVDCVRLLDAWNFCDDLADLHHGPPTPYKRWSRAAQGCYQKLFWGCNLPSVTPPGKRFDPVWRRDELSAIRRVLLAGRTLLNMNLAGRWTEAGGGDATQWEAGGSP